MAKIKLSPKTITLWVVGFSLMPRLLGPGAFGIGTLSIILFWAAILTLLPDYLKEYETKKTSIKNLNPFTKYIFLISFIIIFLNTILSNFIYSNNRILIIEIIKDFAFIVYPLISVSWLIEMKKGERIGYVMNVIILTFGLFSVIKLPGIIGETIPIGILNRATASISATLLSLIYYKNIDVSSNTFSGENFLIEVGSGCSATPQIIVSLYALLIFYICVKLRSKMYLLIVIVSSIVTAFLLNCIRITALGYTVIIDKEHLFDFWHTGSGSLIFSLIVMFISSYIYYRFWYSENVKIKQD